jgi:hypothetical protein
VSEEISVGVEILLKRVKSNPEELMEDYGKWGRLREAVFDYKEKGERQPWLRGLREDEIDLLYEAFCTGSRQVFDNYVMKQVLDGDEKEEYFGQAALDKAMAKRGLQVNPPGSWQTVRSEVVDTPLAIALKRKLEAMWTR